MRTRKDDLPAAVEIELITRLFNALPQILCVTTGLLTGSAFMFCETGDPWMAVILGFAAITSIIGSPASSHFAGHGRRS